MQPFYPSAQNPTTRRDVITGISVALFATAWAAPGRQIESLPSERPASAPEFLRLSQALTGHSDLDPLTSDRFAAAFLLLAPEIHAEFGPLSSLLLRNPQALLQTDRTAGLRSAALAIVAAWYTGTVGTGPKALTASYVDALMQRPVSDALAPPTYVLGGPGWWTAPVPEVGLSRPQAVAPPPATVGNPEPKS